MIYVDRFTGHELRYAFQYLGAEQFMRPYISPSRESDFDIMASKAYIESQRPYYTECTEDTYVEYKSLICRTSLALLPYRSCLFHAAAFRWKGFAWLMTGPSGAGKTTQYKNWKRVFRSDVEMICGDMPLIDLSAEGRTLVRPTPWNGKERIRGKVSAPLGGIVILEQTQENAMEPLGPSESAVPILLQLALRPDTEEQIRQMEMFENRLLAACPVWKLKNRGDMDSVLLAAEVFARSLERGQK